MHAASRRALDQSVREGSGSADHGTAIILPSHVYRKILATAQPRGPLFTHRIGVCELSAYLLVSSFAAGAYG